MRSLSVWVGMSLLLLTGVARAEGAAEAIGGFGLVGTWSPDCAKDPVKEHGFRMTFSIPGAGPPTETIVLSSPINPAKRLDWQITSAVRVAKDRIEVRSVFIGGEELVEPHRKIAPLPTVNATIAKMGDKILVGEHTSNIYEKCLN
jgi:hypothetical protein